jgi:hypothetical protein
MNFAIAWKFILIGSPFIIALLIGGFNYLYKRIKSKAKKEPFVW